MRCALYSSYWPNRFLFKISKYHNRTYTCIYEVIITKFWNIPSRWFGDTRSQSPFCPNLADFLCQIILREYMGFLWLVTSYTYVCSDVLFWYFENKSIIGSLTFLQCTSQIVCGKVNTIYEFVKSSANPISGE